MEPLKNNVKKYEYPFQELKDILDKYRLFLVDEETLEEIKFNIISFRDRLMEGLGEDEKEHFKIYISTVDQIRIDKGKIIFKCGNLFTACILYGKYVPYSIIKDYEEIKRYDFDDGSYIEDSWSFKEYMYIISNSKEAHKTGIKLRKMLINGKTKIF